MYSTEFKYASMELKFHLYCYRYKPSEETLLLIDCFCANIICECDISPNSKLSPWSRSLSQCGPSGTSSKISLMPLSSFASGELVKSLKYVRSLVAQAPKRSFQAASMTGTPTALRQLPPSLSSLLSKSFSSHVNPANVKESSELKESSAASRLNSSITETVTVKEDYEFIASDISKWRWQGHQQTSLFSLDR